MAPSATAAPAAELSHLPKADGSAIFSHGGYSVTASVNGPLEAGRRDENPFQAVVDVNVRPAAGVGGTAERQLEAILQPALGHVIPLRNFPRCVIQVTLQITEMPENAYVNAKITQAQLNLALLPALLHASMLGLLTAAISLKTVASAVTLAVLHDSGGPAVKADPSPADIARAGSVHVLGFAAGSDLLLAESEGAFTVDEWDRVLREGERICCQTQDAGGGGGGMDLDAEGGQSVKGFMRSVMQSESARGWSWK
ncbi:Exosome complex component RRP46 [Escovopsis weberi]|uniref:Exosome complex component RRP46 n=1 Tax=Escovopsis weberi TaxID=150374 RepID=A0A0N0RSU0_ESCWE|nr:Exosome complex component RRP46 [Escovopsis weberi]